MGATVRLRFVAFDLADGWIELQRSGVWTLKYPERRGELRLSMFPVSAGVTMDLSMLHALSRERRNNPNAILLGQVLLDEASWSLGSLFCLATSVRQGTVPPSSRGASPDYLRYWTVSDGVYVLEATFHEYDEERFGLGVVDCDAMMRSVRFEGPS
jgi:hypothetical protein